MGGKKTLVLGASMNPSRYSYLAMNTEVLRLTEFANRLDLPSVTVPGGSSDPQPIGLMLTGKRGGDVVLLDLAVMLEDAMSSFGP